MYKKSWVWHSLGTAANLVWNLDPRDESTVRQLRPHPPHPPNPYIGRSLWEFPAVKSSTSFRSNLCLVLLTPTESLASHLYASIHSSNTGVQEDTKIFFISFQILPNCETRQQKYTPASSLFPITKGFFSHFFVCETSHGFPQIQFVWIFCFVSNSTFEMWPLRIYGWR